MESTCGAPVRVVDSVEGIMGLRRVWQEKVGHPEADIDVYLGLLEARNEVLKPHLMILDGDDGRAKSLLVGRIEARRLDLDLGDGRLALPPVRCLTVVGAEVFGDSSDQSVSALLGSVIDSLKSGQADIAYFHRLDPESRIYRKIAETGGTFGRDYWPTFNDHWIVSLPDTYAEFLQQRSANTRRNIKRYSKRFCETYSGQITVRYFKDCADLDTLIRDTEAIAQKTYHRGLQVGFIDNEETRQRLNHYAEQGRFRAYLLYLGEKPVAFWNGFWYDRTFFTWTTGYDPEYHEARAGLFLLQKLFEDLCTDRVADVVDFGPGDAQYKRDWCNQNQRQVSTYLFAPNLKGAMLNMIRTPLIGGSRAARWALGKAGMLQAVRKLRRSQLSQQARQKLADV